VIPLGDSGKTQLSLQRTILLLKERKKNSDPVLRPA
jgi:hypothetical protein